MNVLIEDAKAIYSAALEAVQARRLLDGIDLTGLLHRAPAPFARIVVIGAGKASMAMAGAVEAMLDAEAVAGVSVVPHGYASTLPAGQRAPMHIDVVEAGHPVPDAAGVQAAERVLALAASCGAGDVLLALISGGGSALLPAFAGGIALDEAQAVFRLLLRSGADIHEVNTVRKHLSRLGGGRLAAAAFPAAVLALVISDVVGDDLSVIASGPTVPDPTTFDDAIAVLLRYGLWDDLPASVRRWLTRGDADATLETPKPGQEGFGRVQTILLGSNADALAAARAEAERRGYAVLGVQPGVTGEARAVGARQAHAALALPAGQRACLLWGGETTVTVRGGGKGGRNQELALGAALALEGRPHHVVLLSGGTDGRDGPTDAAGAWATPETAPAARAQGRSPEVHLEENDAYPFFEALGALLRPGPTHTNVMDLQIALTDGHSTSQ